MSPELTPPPGESQAITTALSTLSARVTVLERWMRRSQRRQMAWAVVALAALALCGILLARR
jgi:hypothetical protein